MENIYPVVLSGGAGSRLWPLSRQKSPKQFIPLIDDKNLLQNTCLRYQDQSIFSPPVIVCNEDHRFQVAESLRNIDINQASIILEPCARNTAPAIALAALQVYQENPEAMMLISPSDHYIENFEELLTDIQNLDFQSECLYTFGIKPTHAETGYGYIQVGKKIADSVYEVSQFIEKPNKERAQIHIEKGNVYWNSGLFLFSAKTYLEQLQQHQLDVYECCIKSFEQRVKDLDFIRVAKTHFEACPNISIDYAVMEKADKIAVIPLSEVKWSDIGSWGALFELGQKDQKGNIIKGDVCQIDTQNCYLRSHDRLLATVGVSGLVVVETADAVLVADRDNTQAIKQVVEMLGVSKRTEAIKHKRHFGPWGYSDRIAKGENFLVNKLYFKAGAESSLQMHYHRTEYFTVLSGAIKIKVEDKEYLLSQGMSITIEPLQKHQVIAIGQLSVEVLEVQLGSYLAEDDIERFEEAY